MQMWTVVWQDSNCDVGADGVFRSKEAAMERAESRAVALASDPDLAEWGWVANQMDDESPDEGWFATDANGEDGVWWFVHETEMED